MVEIHMAEIQQAARLLGFYGPILIIMTCLYFLWNRPPYWFLYIVGLLFNIGLNTFLKLWIKEPRPNGYLQHVETPDAYTSLGQEYGMPSGHAQMVIYSLVFVVLLGYDWTVLATVASLSAITIIQRFLDHKHTSSQLLVGGLVGSGLAWVLVYCMKTYYRGGNKMR